MQRIVQKFSIVYVSMQEKTEVFRSMDEIPAEVRERLIRIARKSQVETLIIANERGREMLHENQQQPEEPKQMHFSSTWKWTIFAVLIAVLGMLVVAAFQFR